MSAELGVTQAALTSFFKILEQQHVPLEDLDAKLREIATHYQTLLVRVRALSADDPQIAQLRDATETAIHAGDFARAEALLNETSARDLAAAQELQDLMTMRLLAAAEAKATNGALKKTQLAYADAAAYYRQAAALVEHLPAGSEEHLARFLDQWGVAAYEAGDYRGAEHPLTRALAICEAVLGAQHPDVAVVVENYAALLQATGCSKEAENLKARAQMIRASHI